MSRASGCLFSFARLGRFLSAICKSKWHVAPACDTDGCENCISGPRIWEGLGMVPRTAKERLKVPSNSISLPASTHASVD